MKNVMIFAVLAAMLLGFAACEKTVVETVAVTVDSPTEGMTLHNGNGLDVKVTFTDPTELHTYSVVVMNETDSITVLNLGGHHHATSLTIDTSIVVNAMMHSDFSLKAMATNHAGEVAEKHVHFHVHP